MYRVELKGLLNTALIATSPKFLMYRVELKVVYLYGKATGDKGS